MPSSRKKKNKAPAPSNTCSLLDVVREHLLRDVFETSNAAVARHHQGESSWMVLVVDPAALRVISSSIGMYNLMERRVSIVEDLLKRRAPFRDQAVLYFVEPSEQSVERIVEDWTPKKGQKGPPYGDTVFLYFLGRLPEKLFSMIKNCKELVKRVKLLKEVNLDFLTKEGRGFHFDMRSPSLYSELYLSDGPSPSQERIIAKLVTVCATLNEYPHVRYPAKNRLCESLANQFQDKMNEFVGANSEWWYNGDGLHPDSERATMLILDRKDDCLSPLMHEFTYEAMARDLLPMDDDRITYENVNAGTAKEGSAETTTKMDALLNDNDEVWVELRGKHIADVIQTLSTKIRDIVGSSTGSALSNSTKDKGKALSINQMAKALAALPEYREIMSKLSQHMQIAHQCMDAFNKQGLLDLSELEQTLATGKTDEGATPKVKELLGQVVEHFRRETTSAMRLRLLAIVIVSQRGLSSEGDLQKLLAEAKLSGGELASLKSLERLGCPLVQKEKSSKNKRVTAFGAGETENESEYSSSRYACLLKSIMEDAASGNLSVVDYPSIMPLPDAEAMLGSVTKSKTVSSVRKATESSKWSKSSTGGSERGKKKTHSGRQIVFMAGGMCYSELRTAREVMSSTGMDIVVGSTSYVTPMDFLGDLQNLA